MDESTAVVCPLCHALLKESGRRPTKRKNTVGDVVVDALHDVDAWAEGDEIAADGVSLAPEDLAQHLAAQLTPVLMKMYRAKRARLRKGRRLLVERMRREQEDVNRLTAGDKPLGRRGRHYKSHCLRNHERTPENTTGAGACRACKRIRQLAIRDKAREVENS